MTDKKTEALKLALEALDELNYCSSSHAADDIYYKALAAINEALAEQPAQPIRWDSNAVDMTGAMATLPKTGSESVVDYKPVISDVGADANIAGMPGTYYGIVLKGTGKITLHEYKPRKPWVGLTKAEVDSLTIYPMNPTADLVKAIEAKLKEKNGA